MMKMSDQVKYQLERAEDALRSALSLAEKNESVYVISAISKALIEIDNSLFAERIEAAAKEGNTAVQGLASKVKYDEHMGVFAPYLGLDEDPYSYYNPKDEPLVDLS